MRRLAAVLAACAALHAPAFEYCDQTGKPREMMRDAKGWHDALEKKRYADLEAAFGPLVAEAEQGAGDGKAERALRAFEKLDEWRESRHRDWQAEHARSAAALLARAHYHLGRGFSLADAGPSRGEEPDEVMRREFAAAREMLGRADRMLRSHSLTDAARIRIAAAEDGHAAALRLARAAAAANPGSLAVGMALVEASGEVRGGRRAEWIATPGRATGLSAADRRYLEYMVYSDLGKVDLAAGRRAEAIRDFEHARPLCPALSYAASELARLYLEDRKYAAVIPIADQLVQGYPTDGFGYHHRGRAYRGLRRNTEAVKDLQQAVDLGYNQAFGELAWFYETGQGVARDNRKALELYTVGEARNVAGAHEGAERVRAALAKEGR